MNNSKLTLMMLGFAAVIFAGRAAGQEGYYLGASVGEAQFRKTCDGVVGACDDKDLAWRLFGGYRLNDSVAIEVGYADLGEVNVNGSFGGVPLVLTGEIKAFDLSVLGAYNATEQFAIFVRAGFHRSQTSVNAVSGGVPSQTSDHNTGFTYGLGLRYALARSLALRAEWQQYESVGGSATGKENVGVISTTLVLNF